MTRAQMEAARARVERVLTEEIKDSVRLNLMSIEKRDALCARFVSAVLGHPDGKAPKVRGEAARVAHLPRRATR